MYICAHNTITGDHPHSDGYFIAAQNENVFDDLSPVIYMNDEFTKKHNICYGEACQIKHVMEHEELVPEYIGFCHYRRFFDDFMEDLGKAREIVDKHGAVYTRTWSSGLMNKVNISVYHSSIFINPLRQAIRETDRSYLPVYDDFLEDAQCSYCNMFIMKHDDFLEGAHFVFDVLKRFDSYFGIDGNKQVEDFMKEQFEKGNWFKGDIKWQRRLDGFISEYLWDLVRRKKFPNAYHSKMRMVGEQDINIKSLD